MTILSRESATALPLFVFHLRPFLQPRWRYEREDFFFVPIAAACDTERGQAQFSARDVKRGHKDEKMNIVKCIHCGNETPDTIGVCQRCGMPWDKSWNEVIKEENEQTEQREDGGEK